MRAVLLFACISLSIGTALAQKPKATTSKPAATKPAPVSPGYAINIKVTPLKNSWIYLYNYYGKADRFQMADSAYLNDKSEGVFKGKEKLHGGIYIVVTPRRVRLF